jgi:hypothetical protein
MIGARWALLAALVSAPGCDFAVNHPAVTTGLVAGTLALGVCKLEVENTGACFAVGGAAGGVLGLVAAAALWLGGDGHSVLVEEQAQPLPDDGRPRRRPAPVPATDVPPIAPAPIAPAPIAPATPPAPAPIAPSSPP